MKVLITSGGTREPIDGVRFVTNMSTGLTGSVIADEFASHGDEVYFVHSIQSHLPRNNMVKVGYSSFRDLDTILKEILDEHAFDAIIHAAAVSDFTPVQMTIDGRLVDLPFEGKLSSEADEMVVRFTRNYKILDRIKDYSKVGNPRVIAFKLTDTKSRNERLEAVRKIVTGGVVDFVVLNDSSEISADGQVHGAQIFDRESLVAQVSNKSQLATTLRRIVQESL